MNNNLCIIRGGYSYCLCTSRQSQITPAVLWINIHTNPVTLRVSSWFPYWLCDGSRCSQSFHNCSHGAPVLVIRDPSYSVGRLECPPRVWYSAEIDTSKFTCHILSVTPGGSQRLKYILLMQSPVLRAVEVPKHARESYHMLIARVVIIPPEDSDGICDIGLSGRHRVHNASDHRLV